jgi:hypothetical protein
MWLIDWAPGWFWIIPLLMLGMVAICMLLMARGSRGGGCGCCGEHLQRHRCGN